MLEKDFPNTTHTILVESPHEVAEKVKKFINEHYIVDKLKLGYFLS